VQRLTSCYLFSFVFCSVVEMFDSMMSSSDAINEQEIVDKWKEVLNNPKTIDEINAVLRDEVGPGVEIVGIQPGSVRYYIVMSNANSPQEIVREA
jgi:hypothetical protein